MGTNFEKVSANDQGWKINTDKSMNKMVSDFVCKKQNIKSLKKYKLPNCNKNISPRSWNNCFGTFNPKMAMYMLEILKMANIMEMVLILLVQMVIFLGRFILASGYMAREMEQV